MQMRVSPCKKSAGRKENRLDFRTTREDVVASCYRALLGREPDAAGLRNWTAVPGQAFSLQVLLDGIMQSEEYARRHVATPRRPPENLVDDRSQFGEVRLLLRDMVNNAARHRLVVDVGANGITGSNSYDLLRHFGWKGLLLEANPQRGEAILRDFAGLDFELVNVAVSDYAGEATFFLGANDDVSSLVAETAQVWGPLRGELRVRVERLSELLATRGIPRDYDLLSVDAEGEDVRILNESTAAGFLPQWVIMEGSQDYSVTSLEQLPLNDVVRSQYVITGRTSANLILKRTMP